MVGTSDVCARREWSSCGREAKASQFLFHSTEISEAVGIDPNRRRALRGIVLGQPAPKFRGRAERLAYRFSLLAGDRDDLHFLELQPARLDRHRELHLETRIGAGGVLALGQRGRRGAFEHLLPNVRFGLVE